MAEIILGIGTSHSPTRSTSNHHEWFAYAQGDRRHRELIDQETGTSVSYEELATLTAPNLR
jgi:hypothetical protein